jgi:hypothetical protein
MRRGFGSGFGGELSQLLLFTMGKYWQDLSVGDWVVERDYRLAEVVAHLWNECIRVYPP